MRNTFVKLLMALFVTTQVSHAQDEICCPSSLSMRGNFTVGGEWLYWKSEQEKLEYGADVEQSINGSDTTRASIILKPKFQYDSGYRVFADYTTCDHLWKFGAAYTHVPTTASNTFQSAAIATEYVALLNVNFNFPILNLVSTTRYVYSEIDSKWNSSLNYCDIDFSRRFHICNNVDILPHAGIRVLWNNQSFRVRGAAIDTELVDPNDINIRGKLSSDLTSVGLEGGFNLSWKIFDHISLIGNLGGSILYANSDSKGYLEIDYEDNTSLTITYKDSVNKGLPMFDAFIGLQYNGCFCNRNWDIHIGWEQHIILNVNDLSANGAGNYTVQGLTLGAALSF